MKNTAAKFRRKNPMYPRLIKLSLLCVKNYGMIGLKPTTKFALFGMHIKETLRKNQDKV